MLIIFIIVSGCVGVYVLVVMTFSAACDSLWKNAEKSIEKLRGDSEFPPE